MSPDKAMIGYLQARIAELEAEVERLQAYRRLDSLPPTAPCPNCGTELTWFKHAWSKYGGVSDEPLPRRGSKEREDG